MTAAVQSIVAAPAGSKEQVPIHDVSSALAAGVGFGLMHALLMCGSVLGQ